MSPTRVLCIASILPVIMGAASAQESYSPGNLLLNSSFEFHAFTPHRLGKSEAYISRNVAFWNTDAWGDITVPVPYTHLTLPTISPV